MTSACHTYPFVRTPSRTLVGIVLLLASATPALAGPRLVRVVWDVGNGAVYVKAYPRTQPGHDAFVVPARRAAAIADDFVLLATSDAAVLAKGDAVRVYVVNYNAVSHAWSDKSTAEAVALAPSLVHALLNAEALAITGAGKLPSTSPSVFNLTGERPAALGTPPDRCSDVKALAAARDMLRQATLRLYDSARTVGDAAPALAAAAGQLGRLATHPKMWGEFESARARTLVMTDPSVLGFDFVDRFKPLADAIAAAGTEIGAANTALLAFDRLAVTPLLAECVPYAKPILQERDDLASFLKEIAGDSSTLHDVGTQWKAALAIWTGVTRSLDGDWATDAVEVVVKDAVQPETVLRVDGIFVSPDKTVDQQQQRSLVLNVKPDVPVLVISSGVAYHQLRFRTFQVSEGVRTAADGTMTAKDQLQIVDDGKWERIVPVWLEHIRLRSLGRWGLYATFGTTPDRNVFNNAILGVTVYRSRWRTALTGGVIGANGLRESDLEAARRTFTGADGFVLSGVTATNVLPAPSWHWSPYVSLTFMLASF